MRICRGFENWRDLRALSGKFLRQKSCYPESFRFLWLCSNLVKLTTGAPIYNTYIRQVLKHNLWGGDEDKANWVNPDDSEPCLVMSIQYNRIQYKTWHTIGLVMFNTIQHNAIQYKAWQYNTFSDVNQLKTHWQRPHVTGTATVQCGDEEVQRLSTRMLRVVSIIVMWTRSDFASEFYLNAGICNSNSKSGMSNSAYVAKY